MAISKLENKLLNKDLIADVNNWLNDKYEVYYTGKAKMRYYVFCTSIKGDSLNMWNYYLKNGKYQGYNIGISLEKILDYIEILKLEKSTTREKSTRCQAPLNFYKQINSHLQIEHKVIDL